ncbi:hypothetical protein X777_09448 [Ooceraea biroi]|uniref:Endonuclease/exonuclease/phosphatase domain-containing protein n=1 Tax=Ooceraea biroi TaxID=2015173 RepID=A0A026WAD1_OOCBI|nr:hypothetical protein X777_09448 [Ooceraea biroi]
MVNEEGWERIKRLEVGDKIDSDHHPVIVVMKGDGKRVKRKKEMGRKGKRGIWTDESRGKYKENLEKIKAGEGTVEEEIEKMNERIKEAMVRKGEGEGEEKRRGWWDEECIEEKKKVRRELRNWRKGRGDKRMYRKKRLEYGKICERKKKEENDRWEKWVVEEIWTVMGYGVEVWGWEEREAMERSQEKYIRWMLGVDGKTPGYMVREEVQREKIRAWGWERRLEEGKGSELARKYLEEIRRGAKRETELSE